MAGDHSRGVVRMAGRPSRPVEVGGERLGRKDTAGVRRSCERGGSLAESFGLSAGAALLKRPRVEPPAAPDPAQSECPQRRSRGIGQPPSDVRGSPYAANRCS